MATYIVSYDLADNQSYDDLHARLKSYDAWAFLTESTWAVVTNQSAVQVRDHLTSTVNENAKLIVISSGGEGAWRNFVPSTTNWLKKYL